jgi:hypothetical protein
MVVHKSKVRVIMSYIIYSIDVSKWEGGELFTTTRRRHCISCGDKPRHFFLAGENVLVFVFKLGGMGSVRFQAMRGLEVLHWESCDVL